MKIRAKIVSILLLLTMLISILPVYAVESLDATSEIPYVADTGTFPDNYDGKVTVYDAETAAANGVPAGYSGYVLRVTSLGNDGAYAGCELDFSSQKIPVADIQSITFRVILPAGHKEMRLIAASASSSWVMRVVPSVFGDWCDIVLDAEGTNFQSGKSLDSLANSDGNLGLMCLISRFGNGNDASFYLDSVSIKYKESATKDKEAPVINYNGPTELTLKEGEAFNLGSISAYDEYDGQSAAISYLWSAGAVDEAGKLTVGNHTYTVKAADRSGNVATLDIKVTVNPNSELIKLENIPHVPHDTSIADAVYEGKVTELSGADAAAKGIPSGYNGSVYEISYSAGKSYVGVCLDFSSYKIPIALVESISFNVLISKEYSELRMRNGNTTDWIMRNSAAPTGTWTSVVLNSDGLNFYGSSKMSVLANSDGNLGSFCLIGRVGGSYEPYYIDSVTIKLKDDDKLAPVLNYSGKTDILTSCGKPFMPAITAYDELEQREIALAYEWSADALDADGNMLRGTHTCRVSATDYFGNTSYIDFNITAGDPDMEAPEILFYASEIYVPTGTYYRMLPIASDNYDDVKVKEEWSAGAIDLGGRLSEGVHTLTLTSVDLSGNTTVKVITVYVLDTDTTVGKLIECGK